MFVWCVLVCYVLVCVSVFLSVRCLCVFCVCACLCSCVVLSLCVFDCILFFRLAIVFACFVCVFLFFFDFCVLSFMIL